MPKGTPKPKKVTADSPSCDSAVLKRIAFKKVLEDESKKVSQKCITETFRTLGIDLHDPRQRERWHENLSYIDSSHKAYKHSIIYAKKLIVGALVTTFLGLAGWGFLNWLG